MSAAKLGRLFPVWITTYNTSWPELFRKESDRISHHLECMAKRIEHIGSTAVPGLSAKDCIDIILEVDPGFDKRKLLLTFKELGYHYIPRPENPPPHIMLARGYSQQGYAGQAYHIHVRYPDNHPECTFRDKLRADPELAARYAGLKEELAEQYRHDRDGYTEAKTDFITFVLKNKAI